MKKMPNAARRLTCVHVVCAIAVALQGTFLLAAPPEKVFTDVKCEGAYRGHLQGICTDDKEFVFWSFTDVLVKTDREGKIVQKIPVASHHGDLCHVDGKIYVAVNLGKFNEPAGQADSWVYVYDSDLNELAHHKVPEVVYGAGGIAYHNGCFIVVGGLPPDVSENYAYEYDKKFQFIKRHVIQSGHTRKGIQVAAFAHGCWWFGCYGSPHHELLKTDASFQMLGRHVVECALGIVPLPDGSFLVGRDAVVPESKLHTGAAVVAIADAEKGLVVRGEKSK